MKFFLYSHSAYITGRVTNTHRQCTEAIAILSTHKTDGPEYKINFWSAIHRGDFKLHMPEEEAINIIAKDGWTGGWSRSGSIPPETIETTGFPFQTRQGRFPLRCIDTEPLTPIFLKPMRSNTPQKFDQNQNVQTLTTKLIEKIRRTDKHGIIQSKKSCSNIAPTTRWNITKTASRNINATKSNVYLM